MSVQLVRYDAARAAQAMAAYARQAKDTELVEWAAEIKVRAERKASELLCKAAEYGERAPRGDHKSESMSKSPTLKDAGITRDQSSRWQKLALRQPTFAADSLPPCPTWL